MTTAIAVASSSVLVAAAGLLFYLAATDLREFKIRNEAVLILGALFFLHAVLSGRWVELHWNIGFAVFAFALMMVCYAQGLMGGGDLKLMTVALLWSGARCALLFLILLAVSALLHAMVAKFGWVEAQRANGRMKIAFAPAIAVGLIGIFLLGCLAPM